MATNSFPITKPVKYNDLFLIQQDISINAGDTNNFDLQLPEGLPLRVVSCQLNVVAACAATATQVLLVQKLSTAGAATTVATFAGASLNAAGVNEVFNPDTQIASACDVDEGGSIRFAYTSAVGDTGTFRASVWCIRR
jgi:hypothetical protein